MGQRFLGSRNADTVEHYISVLRTVTKDSQVIAAAFGVMAKDIANVSSHAVPPYNLLTALPHAYVVASFPVAPVACSCSSDSELCCAVLCCAVLCCAVLCCAVLCCAVLCCAVLCCACKPSRHYTFLHQCVSCFFRGVSMTASLSPFKGLSSISLPHCARPVPLQTFKCIINDVGMILA